VGIRILSEGALPEIRNLLMSQKTAVSKEIADAAAPATRSPIQTAFAN
jgi:hypothetical protein